MHGHGLGLGLLLPRPAAAGMTSRHETARPQEGLPKPPSTSTTQIKKSRALTTSTFHDCSASTRRPQEDSRDQEADDDEVEEEQDPRRRLYGRQRVHDALTGRVFYGGATSPGEEGVPHAPRPSPKTHPLSDVCSTHPLSRLPSVHAGSIPHLPAVHRLSLCGRHAPPAARKAWAADIR